MGAGKQSQVLATELSPASNKNGLSTPLILYKRMRDVFKILIFKVDFLFSSCSFKGNVYCNRKRL